MARRQSNRRGGGAGLLLLAAAAAGAAALFYRPVRSSLADMTHRQVERLLSNLLGARVQFRRFHASPLSGTVEIEGMSVTRHGSGEPMLTVERVQAEVALSQALRGQMVITAMRMERPILSLVRRESGTARSNVPESMQVDPRTAPQKAERALEMAEDAAEAVHGLGLGMDVRRALLTDGEVHYRDESLGQYHLSAGRIIGQLDHAGNGYEFNGVVESVGRRDRPAELGEVHVTGRVENIDDLAEFPHARIVADVNVGEQMHQRIEVPSVESRTLRMTVDGEMELAQLTPLLPEGVKVFEPIRAAGTQGRIELRGTVTYDPDQGLRIPEMNQNVRDVTVGGTQKSGA